MQFLFFLILTVSYKHTLLLAASQSYPAWLTMISFWKFLIEIPTWPLCILCFYHNKHAGTWDYSLKCQHCPLKSSWAGKTWPSLISHSKWWKHCKRKWFSCCRNSLTMCWVCHLFHALKEKYFHLKRRTWPKGWKKLHSAQCCVFNSINILNGNFFRRKST